MNLQTHLQELGLNFYRDMGPRACYLGLEVPKEELIWQDPISRAKYKLKKVILMFLKQKYQNQDFLFLNWFLQLGHQRQLLGGSDRRGGANGARIRLEPQKTGKRLTHLNCLRF